MRRWPSPDRLAQRWGAALSLVVLAVAFLFSGDRLFFCSGMERVHRDHTCCEGFEPELATVAMAQPDLPAVSDDDQCCSAIERAVLPASDGVASAPPVEPAPLRGVVPPPPSLQLASAASPSLARRESRSVGPPPLSATALCARLGVFLV